MKQKLHCPRCGHDGFFDLFGGCCEFRCARCGHGCNCSDPFTKEIEKESVPLRRWQHRKHIKELQRKYKPNKGELQETPSCK